jgi:hypothetical protein
MTNISIKPLEWFDARFSDLYERVAAHTILGDYSAGEYSDGGAYFTCPPGNEDQFASSVDFAKAFAQTDYETRIRSALSDVKGETEGEFQAWISSEQDGRYLDESSFTISVMREAFEAGRSSSPVKLDTEGWEPIETALKDGTKVLAAFWLWNDPKKGRGMEVVSWDGEAWSSDGDPIYPPTHWHPLPASPKQGEKE